MQHFEVHWCTGWGEKANEVISPLHGLPEFPVVSMDRLIINHPVHWKFEAIVDHVGDRPYAFVDDEITIIGVLYSEERTRQGFPTLHLQIDCAKGLTDDHVERLIEWADNEASVERRTGTATDGAASTSDSNLDRS